LRNIFIVSLIIAITLPAIVIIYIYPSFTIQLIKNTEDEAIRVARHLMALIIPDKNELTKDSVSAELMNKIQEVTEDFKLMKLKIFSKSGKTIYSTSSKDIGVINKNIYFHDIVAKGKVYTKVVEKDAKSLEDQIVTVDVVETYVPIMKSDAFVGAFEIYYDITARKESLEAILSTSSVLLFILVISLMGSIISVLIRAGKNIIRREQIEEALRESEVFIRSVIDNLPIGIAVNSVDPTVEFDYMNDNFPKFYRTTREQLTDLDSFWDSVYEEPEFREEMKKRVLDDCASGDPERMYWLDVPITRKGDETFFITARNIPIPDKQLMISTVWVDANLGWKSRLCQPCNKRIWRL
jgi:hypothetical protein